MSIWQAMLVISFALAVFTGRPKHLLISVMALNFLITAHYRDDLFAVAVADIVAASILVGEGRREDITAYLFLMMPIIYGAGYYLGLKLETIYALVEVLAYIQIFTIGGWGVGLHRLYRSARRNAGGRPRRSVNPAISRDHVSRDQG